MKKHFLVKFILGGGTPADLKNLIRENLWNPVQFALWCEEAADGITASDSTFPAHHALTTAAEEFRSLR